MRAKPKGFLPYAGLRERDAEDLHVTDPESEPPEVSSPLKNPRYRFILGSNVAFFLALHGQGIVRSWLAFELTGSKLALGAVSAAVAIPMLIVAPFGGVIADRMERRRLILLAQGAVLLSELTLVTLLWLGKLEYWHLLCGASVMGFAFPISMPARQAIVANVVGREALTAAIAIGMGAMSATRVLGPLISGVLIDVIGVRGTYSVGASLFFIALCTLAGVPRHQAEIPAGGHATVMADLREGFRYLIDNRILGLLLVFGLVPMMLALPAQQLMVVFAQDVWHVGSSGFGVLQAMSGVGGVLGAIWVSRRKGRKRLRVMVGSGLGFAALLSLFALSPWFYPAVALALIGYSLSAVYQTLNSSAIQMLLPDSIRGRVSSFMMMSVSLPLLGTLPVGALADRIGAPLAVSLACAAGAAFVSAFYLSSPTLRSLDTLIATGETLAHPARTLVEHEHSADSLPPP